MHLRMHKTLFFLHSACSIYYTGGFCRICYFSCIFRRMRQTSRLPIHKVCTLCRKLGMLNIKAPFSLEPLKSTFTYSFFSFCRAYFAQFIKQLVCPRISHQCAENWATCDEQSPLYKGRKRSPLLFSGASPRLSGTLPF